MKKMLIIPFVCFLLSCDSNNDRFIRKKIEENGVTITWFFYSYITNESPDFVTIKKDGVEREIFKAIYVVVDVTLEKRNIKLRLVPPSKGLIFTKEIPPDVFGYKVILDTTGSYDELQLIPEGIKEGN